VEAAGELARSRQPAQAEANFASGGLGKLLPGIDEATAPVTPKATPVEDALDSKLVIPGREEARGPAQILGASGDVLSTVARAEKPVPSGTASPIPTLGDIRCGPLRGRSSGDQPAQRRDAGQDAQPGQAGARHARGPGLVSAGGRGKRRANRRVSRMAR
jgi:hypothetical protein